MEENKLNHIVKDKIKKVEDKLVPGTGWNKEKSWHKIKEILNTKNKQLIMWYFATAASISILIAATSDKALVYLPFLHEESKTEIASITAPVLNEVQKSLFSHKIEMEIIEKKGLESFKKVNCSKTKVKPIEIKTKTPNVLFEEKATKKPIQFDVQGSVNINKISGFNPGISAGFKYVFLNKENFNKYVIIGLSTNFIYQNTPESSNSRLYPATFVNAKYGQSKRQENSFKEWEMSAGYLLNPNQIIYKDTTIRLQYTRTIGNKFKIGPELIFTDNLKKVYPGITLAFG